MCVRTGNGTYNYFVCRTTTNSASWPRLLLCVLIVRHDCGSVAWLRWLSCDPWWRELKALWVCSSRTWVGGWAWWGANGAPICLASYHVLKKHSFFPEPYISAIRSCLVASGFISCLYSIWKPVPLASRKTDTKQFPRKSNSPPCLWLQSPCTEFFLHPPTLTPYHNIIWRERHVAPACLFHRQLSFESTFEPLQPKETAKKAARLSW